MCLSKFPLYLHPIMVRPWCFMLRMLRKPTAYVCVCVCESLLELCVWYSKYVDWMYKQTSYIPFRSSFMQMRCDSNGKYSRHGVWHIPHRRKHTHTHTRNAHICIHTDAYLFPWLRARTRTDGSVCAGYNICSGVSTLHIILCAHIHMYCFLVPRCPIGNVSFFLFFSYAWP